MTVRGAHLVGSVPLSDTEAVMSLASSTLGDRLARIPDGETGERSGWIAWQRPLFSDHPRLVLDDGDGRYGSAGGALFRVSDDSDEPVEFGDLGYAAAAIDSYDTFRILRGRGTIADDCRFQVCLPTPLSTVMLWVDSASQEQVQRGYEAAMTRELTQILDAIAPEDLAIQWDTAIEFAVLEGCFPSRFSDDAVFTELTGQVRRLVEAVPEPVEVGLHLCYGDAGHRHFIEPADTSLLTSFANTVTGEVRRPIQWIHMPVPRGRDDDAYFEPLQQLDLPTGTELYLGLVHATDGVAGTERRIRTALRHVSSFGVATECGFGRREPDTVGDLLATHAAVTAPR